MHGLAFGVSTSASLVAVGDSVPEKRLNKALTYFGMTSILSVITSYSIHYTKLYDTP